MEKINEILEKYDKFIFTEGKLLPTKLRHERFLQSLEQPKESVELNRFVDLYGIDTILRILENHVTGKIQAIKPKESVEEFLDKWWDKEIKIDGLNFDENFTTQYGYLYEYFKDLLKEYATQQKSINYPSDEEIIKTSKTKIFTNNLDFVDGAKWAIEQIKKIN